MNNKKVFEGYMYKDERLKDFFEWTFPMKELGSDEIEYDVPANLDHNIECIFWKTTKNSSNVTKDKLKRVRITIEEIKG